MGYAVAIFEASQVPGGMLYLGLPEYRLSRDVVGKLRYARFYPRATSR